MRPISRPVIVLRRKQRMAAIRTNLLRRGEKTLAEYLDEIMRGL